LNRAREWKCEAVVARAIRSSWERFELADATPLSAWAGRYVPTPNDLRWLRGYTGADRRYARQALAGLRTIRGVKGKAAYVRAHLGDVPRLLRTARVLTSGRGRH
jgi:hypothetical protein